MPYTPEQAKAYREANKERRADYHRQWRARNKETLFAQKKAWRDANKEHVTAKIKAWSEKNPSKWREYTSARKALQLRATPAWANLEAVAEVYTQAAFLTDVLGEPHHVDHIVPLCSKLVCGLHNQFNLQVLPAKENQEKSNRFWPDMP